MSLDLHLKIVGVSLIVLGLAHFLFPRRFGWKEELERLSPLNRQIFWVHNWFDVLTIVMFGVLSLVYTDSLLAHSQLAQVVLIGLFMFWLSRLYVQFFVYDSGLWKGNRFNTRVHIAFSLTWLYYVVVYGCALLHQFEVV